MANKNNEGMIDLTIPEFEELKDKLDMAEAMMEIEDRTPYPVPESDRTKALREMIKIWTLDPTMSRRKTYLATKHMDQVWTNICQKPSGVAELARFFPAFTVNFKYKDTLTDLCKIGKSIVVNTGTIFTLLEFAKAIEEGKVEQYVFDGKFLWISDVAIYPQDKAVVFTLR